jgi:DNA-binding response OmpR family regulator
MSPRLERVRVPDTFPRERVVLGELHLLRRRLDEMLGDVARVIETSERPHEGWLRVEEASRLARRALTAAVGAVPPLPLVGCCKGELRVGELRVDPLARRQWYGDVEFELTPLHHRLLAVMAADPFRLFAKEELFAAVWRHPGAGRSNAVNTSVSRVRGALVRAGASRTKFMISLHGVGWALTRPM